MMRVIRTMGWLLCVAIVSACASGGGGSSPNDTGTPSMDSGARDGDLSDTAPDGELPGVCAGVDCSGLDEGCMMGVCDPMDGSCALRARPEGSVCDDGDPCTSGDVCASGACAGAAVDCSASGDACSVGTCDPATGSCVSTPVGDGAACDDGDACTSGATCSAGVCGGGAPLDCSGLADACHTASCDPATGCVSTPMADGTACDDGNACTSGDLCAAGTCAGAAVDCSGAGDACNVGVCDVATGSCATTPAADGTACDDGDACTSGDVCGVGRCAGTPITTGACADATVTFPSSSDTRVASAGIYFWRVGDYVEGARTTTLPSATSADISFQIAPNSLSCDTQDVQLRINGVAVGSFSIAGGATNVTRSFTFPAIAGPTYTLRYQTVRQVGSGCGSAGYTNDVSTVTLHR